MTETKKVVVNGEEMYMTRVPNTVAWFESREDGTPVLNNGEKETAQKAGRIVRSDKYEIWVTIGPYRAYDIAGSINWEDRVARIDLYSVRPGTNKELAQILVDLATKIKNHEAQICKHCGLPRAQHTGKEDYCPTPPPKDEAEKHIVPPAPTKFELKPDTEHGPQFYSEIGQKGGERVRKLIEEAKEEE